MIKEPGIDIPSVIYFPGCVIRKEKRKEKNKVITAKKKYFIFWIFQFKYTFDLF